MTESFQKAIDFVLKCETMDGRVIMTDRAEDPGGLTKYGISQKAYPRLDIAGLTMADAIDIYKRDYWERCNCDMLTYPLDIAVFNFAVTSGAGTARRIREKSLTYPDFIMHCIKYYIDIKGQVLEGWINRILDLYWTFPAE
jgi:lysozyme family protein